MTKDEILSGLKSGRRIIQHMDCSDASEIKAVDALISDGAARIDCEGCQRCLVCGFGETTRQVSLDPSYQKRRVGP